MNLMLGQGYGCVITRGICVCVTRHEARPSVRQAALPFATEV